VCRPGERPGADWKQPGRHADPEPRRARRESSASLKASPAAALAARLKAAKAEAEEAIPTPVGKLLLLSTRAKRCSAAIWRTRSRTALTRSRLLPD